MISISPSLQFMRGIYGIYVSENRRARLRIWGCGYAVPIDLQGPYGSEVVGVVGAFGQDLELFAAIARPDVIRFIGVREVDDRVVFTATESDMRFSLKKEEHIVRVSLWVNGAELISHALRNIGSVRPR